jgi:hypothetical protein
MDKAHKPIYSETRFSSSNFKAEIFIFEILIVLKITAVTEEK